MNYNGLENFKNKVKESFLSGIGNTELNSLVNTNKYSVFPGFVDVHVHLREPGFCYKETVLSGTLAAARGGYTTVCSMPNLNPVPDSLQNLNVQINIIKNSAKINVLPYGAITEAQQGIKLSNMEEISPYTVAFSDDGKGVQSDILMKKAMEKSKLLNKIIVAHCEDNSLLNGGYINKGEYAKNHNHKGICSESEWKPIKRDIELVKQTGCKYHVCHISTKESVELIRKAKAEGVDITCETAPHYLLLNDSMLKEDGSFKMNPPIRSEEDRVALIEAVKDGTIDIIATDHAPHSEQEKSQGLKNSLMGIVGIETAFSLLYTYLVKQNIISLEKLIELMCINPRKRFNIPLTEQDFCVWNLNEEYKIDPNEFLSKGKSTPFKNYKVNGKCMLTVSGGKIAYKL